MKDLAQKAEIIAQAAGAVIKGILGDKAEFIIIPMVDTGDGLQTAVISTLSGRKLCTFLAAAACKTIDEFEPETADKIKEDLKSKVPGTQFH